MGTNSARFFFRQLLGLLKTVLAHQETLRQPLFDLSVSALQQHSFVSSAHAAHLLRGIRHLDISVSAGQLLPLLSSGSPSHELAIEAAYFLMTVSNFDEHAANAVEHIGVQLAAAKDWWALYSLACQALVAGGHSWARFACAWLQLIPKSNLSETMHNWISAVELIAQAENVVNNVTALVVASVQDAVKLYYQALFALRSVVFQGQILDFQTQLVELRVGLLFSRFVCVYF
jgi:hypothetical protein